MKMEVFVNRFYPETFKRKADAEKYQSKGTCEVHLQLGPIEMDLKNITYRVSHSGSVVLKPPFRVHSDKKAGKKPKLVPSIVFKEGGVWPLIENTIKMELSKHKDIKTKRTKDFVQLEFWDNSL